MWNENGNVSVGLSQRIVDLVSKLEDLVLNVALGFERGQIGLFDDGLQVAEAVLRVIAFSVSLCHLKYLLLGRM